MPDRVEFSISATPSLIARLINSPRQLQGPTTTYTSSNEPNYRPTLFGFPVIFTTGEYFDGLLMVANDGVREMTMRVTYGALLQAPQPDILYEMRRELERGLEHQRRMDRDKKMVERSIFYDPFPKPRNKKVRSLILEID